MGIVPLRRMDEWTNICSRYDLECLGDYTDDEIDLVRIQLNTSQDPEAEEMKDEKEIKKPEKVRDEFEKKHAKKDD